MDRWLEYYRTQLEIAKIEQKTEIFRESYRIRSEMIANYKKWIARREAEQK